MRTSALEREMKRANAEDHVMDKEALLAWLSSFDDDREADLQKEEYYRDHQLWARKRVEFRRKEREKDERDREAESREVNKDRSRAAALADSFLEQQVFELVGAATKGPPAATSGFAQPLRLRMTRDAVKTTPASPAKRTVEEVEGLLEEDEEDDYQASSKKRRLLIPLEEEREEPRHPKQSNEEQIRNLVAEIPSDKEGLWKYPVYWEGMDDVQPHFLISSLRSSLFLKARFDHLLLKRLLRHLVSKNRKSLTLLLIISLTVVPRRI